MNVFVDDTGCRILCEEIALEIKKRGAVYRGIYAIARGGINPAIHLSYILDIPIVAEPSKYVLVVDDVVDTGRTIKRYKNYIC